VAPLGGDRVVRSRCLAGQGVDDGPEAAGG
jgi:hypothetical protein